MLQKFLVNSHPAVKQKFYSCSLKMSPGGGARKRKSSGPGKSSGDDQMNKAAKKAENSGKAAPMKKVVKKAESTETTAKDQPTFCSTHHFTKADLCFCALEWECNF